MESSWRRAWGDTEHLRHTVTSFWGLEIVGASVLGFGGGYGGFLLTPENATRQIAFIYPAVGSAVGIIVGLVIVFLLIYVWNLLRAPYRQRNEVRVANIQLKQEYEELKRGIEEQKQSTFHFEFNDSSMTTKDGRILLGVTFKSDVDVIVDNLQLEINGKQFQPSDWHPFKLRQIHTKNYTFDLVNIRAVSDMNYQEAKFTVNVDNSKRESSAFSIHNLL